MQNVFFTAISLITLTRSEHFWDLSQHVLKKGEIPHELLSRPVRHAEFKMAMTGLDTTMRKRGTPPVLNVDDVFLD